MIRYRARRAAVSLLALSVVTSGVAVIGTTGAATAAPHWGNTPSVQIGYTDSANPRRRTTPESSTTCHSAPGRTRRACSTPRGFTPPSICPASRGRRIYDGSVFIRESSAADCSKRAIEIWRTERVDATPTWKRAPAPLVKTDEILTPEYCPTASLTFDVAAAVQDAVQKRQRRITFEIRVPEQYETDPAYGRRLNWYNSVRMSVRFNSVPTIDSNHLYNGGFPCTGLKPYPRLGYYATSLQAVGADADEWDGRDLLTTVAIWPTGQPENRAEFTEGNGISGRANSVGLPDGTLVDGTSYAWQARVGDGADASGWSKKCYFTYDRTNPTSPTVTSPNYPRSDAGQLTPLGVPGSFTFSGNGNKDVAGFAYSWQELGGSGCSYGDLGQLVCPDPFGHPGTVRANAPGGSATVALSPERSGSQRRDVRSIDLAGNVSPAVTYEIMVPSSTPTVTELDGPPEWGQQVRLKFSPAAGVTASGYEYTLDGGEPQTLQADSEGNGYLSFHASDPNGHQMKVRSRSDNGFLSEETNWYASFYPWPGVRSEVYWSNWEPVGGVGIQGDFTFSPPPGWTDTTAYQYTFDGELAEVAAGADGRATISWTPTASGSVTLTVYAVRADGSISEYANWYSFEVAAAS